MHNPLWHLHGIAGKGKVGWSWSSPTPHYLLLSRSSPATSRGFRSKQEMMPGSKSEPDFWIPGWAEDPSDFLAHRAHTDTAQNPLQEGCRECGVRREGALAPPELWHLAVSASAARHKLVCCVIFCVSFLILSTAGALLPGAFEHSWSSGWGFSCREISLVQIQSAVPTHLDYCTHHKCWGFCYSHFRVKVFSMCILSLRGSQLRGIDAKACTSPKSHGGILLQARDQRKPTVHQSW